MSADNFDIIRKHPLGGYCIVGGSASYEEEDDEDYPHATKEHEQFKSVAACINAIETEGEYGQRYYSEYGYSIHDECGPLNEGSEEETEALVLAAKSIIAIDDDENPWATPYTRQQIELLRKYVERNT